MPRPMKMYLVRTKVLVQCVLASPLAGLACGNGAQTASHTVGGSSDGGTASVDGMGGGCSLPAAPAALCSALPTGQVSPCSPDGGQPSQAGYLEIDSPGSSPTYVCATSWSTAPSVGYVFGQPGTFMSQAQSCCGGSVS